MSPASRAPVVVLGIGSVFRSDDGVGPEVISRLQSSDGGRPRADVEFIELDGEPFRTIEMWRGRQRAIVVDAVVAGAPAGTVHRLVAGRDQLPAADHSPSSHDADLPEAYALGEALDLLPDELIVLGVEVSDVSVGRGLSDAVAAVIPDVVRAVLVEVER